MALWSVIESAGEKDAVIWKHPKRDFVTNSTLIVRETQKAMFFYQGRLADVLGPGSHVLHTGTLPIIGKLQTLPTSGESPFIAEVYFVSNALGMSMKWGTTSQAVVQDQTYGLIFHIGACGTFSIRVTDPYAAFQNLVGTGDCLRYGQLQEFFRENVTQQVKEYYSRAFAAKEMNFLTVNQGLTKASADIERLLNTRLEDLGIQLYNFVISTLNFPEEEYAVIAGSQQELQRMSYENQLKTMQAMGEANVLDINTQAQSKAKIAAAVAEADALRIMSAAQAESRKLQGFTWQDEKKAEQGLAYANNPNVVSNPASMLAQAPMALSFGNMLYNNLDPLLNTPFSSNEMNMGYGSDYGTQDSGFGGIGLIEPEDDGADSSFLHQEERTSTVYCYNCGAAMDVNANFCSKCGTRMKG